MHGYASAINLLANELRGCGVKVREYTGCLCSGHSCDKLPDIALCHPGDVVDCLEVCRDIVVSSPETTFYIFMGRGSEIRASIIGKHPNVHYVTLRDGDEVLERFWRQMLEVDEPETTEPNNSDGV